MTDTQADTAYGKVEMEGAHAALVFERWLDASPERVWAALTDSDEFDAWYMASSRIGCKAGDGIDMVTGPARFHWTGRILAFEPFSLLEYEMNAEPRDFLPQGERSVVRYALEPRDGGTLLRLRHTNLTTPTALGFAPGTHALLDRLHAHLAGARLPGWPERYEAVKSGYPAWDGPTGQGRRTA